jgi:hypothetical protein
VSRWWWLKSKGALSAFFRLQPSQDSYSNTVGEFLAIRAATQGPFPIPSSHMIHHDIITTITPAVKLTLLKWYVRYFSKVECAECEAG